MDRWNALSKSLLIPAGSFGALLFSNKMSTDTNETIYDRVKAYEDMDDDDRAFAIHSARYILEDVSMERMAEISGLQRGMTRLDGYGDKYVDFRLEEITGFELVS